MPSAEELKATREAFWKRLGYIPGPKPQSQTMLGRRICRDDTSLDYYDRLMGRTAKTMVAVKPVKPGASAMGALALPARTSKGE